MGVMAHECPVYMSFKVGAWALWRMDVVAQGRPVFCVLRPVLPCSLRGNGAWASLFLLVPFN